MIAAVACLAIVALALVTDLRERRIPNALTASAAGLGIAFHLAVGEGLGFALLGAALGGLCLLGPFALGGMGGGDVKLLASLGAWLGPTAVLATFAYTAICGAVFVLVVAAWRRWSLDWRVPLSDLNFVAATGERPTTGSRHTLPYSVAIAAGSVAFVTFGVPL